MMSQTYVFSPIATIHSPFKEKFGVPKQAGLAAHATALVKFIDSEPLRLSLSRLSEFSHVWLVFVFHKNADKPWTAFTEPPAEERVVGVGTLASRGPHRPNPIGMSAVRLEKTDIRAKNGPELWVSGIDLLDGTPLLDIKPYVPYTDAHPHASSGWCTPGSRTTVQISPQVQEQIRSLCPDPGFENLVRDVVALDPRPASLRQKVSLQTAAEERQVFAFNLDRFEILVQFTPDACCVTEVRNARPNVKLL